MMCSIFGFMKITNDELTECVKQSDRFRTGSVNASEN